MLEKEGAGRSVGGEIGFPAPPRYLREGCEPSLSSLAPKRFGVCGGHYITKLAEYGSSSNALAKRLVRPTYKPL